MRHCVRFLGLWAFALASAATADEIRPVPGWDQVGPVLSARCYDCHQGADAEGGVDLAALADHPQVAEQFQLWSRVQQALRDGEMPPKEEPQLADNEKTHVLAWLDRSLDAVVQANAGDPGPVTLRRLTNGEYDATIRDLTGREFALSATFMPDGGGGEGFSNLGDVLFVSPQQFEKYLAAARTLAEHATILPGSGLEFHEGRVGLRGAEQVKAQVEQALYVWYQKMAGPHLPKDGEDLRERDYLLACWKHRHRELTGADSLADLAAEAELSPAFLHNWWGMLNREEPKSRYLDLTRVAWRELPPPDAARPEQPPEEVLQRIEAIAEERRSWYEKRGEWAGTQRRQQDADGLRSYQSQVQTAGRDIVHLVASDVLDGGRGDYVLVRNFSIERKGKRRRYLLAMREELKSLKQDLKTSESREPLEERIAELEAGLGRFGKHPLDLPVDAETLVLHAPEVVTLPLPAGTESFRAEGRLDMSAPENDFASVQWTVAVDPPPDPRKVLPGVLTIFKRQTPMHQAVMTEFGEMKKALPDIYDRRLEEVARNYLRGDSNTGVYYFSNEQLRELLPAEERLKMERMLLDWRFVRGKLVPKIEQEWDARLQSHLQRFASLAWRRPLDEAEQTELTHVYTQARESGMDRESAAREVVVRILVAPDFLFKLEEARGEAVHPVSAWELATRLSYFLWSSLPDEPLRAAAADGSLLRPEVLAEQTQRMLRDPRAAALAREFAGQWLEFKGFDQNHSVDAEKFPEFTPELRADLYAEVVAFLEHIVRADRPVREILLADYTFLNERLAKHYGISEVAGDELRQVAVADYERGGILGMGALLTKTSYPHRTSPVLRGNWLLKSVLGTPTPPPPADVPPLTEDSAQPTSLRERLEKHREHRACSGCHDKIDPLGFALEGFDPLGRRRELDDLAQKIDTSADPHDGEPFTGVAGLRTYLASHDEQFYSLFSRKLLGYALGREVLPTDRPLLEQMQKRLDEGEGRFSSAVLAVVQSRQFQFRRNEAAAPSQPTVEARP